MIYIVDIKYDSIGNKVRRVAICNSAFGAYVYDLKDKWLHKICFDYSGNKYIHLAKGNKCFEVVNEITYCWDEDISTKENKTIENSIKTLFALYGDDVELFKILFTSCEHRHDYWNEIVERFKDKLPRKKGFIYKGYNGEFKGVSPFGWTYSYTMASYFGESVVELNNADIIPIGGKECEAIYIPTDDVEIRFCKPFRIANILG